MTPSASRESAHGLAAQGLAPKGTLHWNLVAPELVQAAIRKGEGQLADMGPFVAVTSPHTGRSPKDKFVVAEPSSEPFWTFTIPSGVAEISQLAGSSTEKVTNRPTLTVAVVISRSRMTGPTTCVPADVEGEAAGDRVVLSFGNSLAIALAAAFTLLVGFFPGWLWSLARDAAGRLF